MADTKSTDAQNLALQKRLDEQRIQLSKIWNAQQDGKHVSDMVVSRWNGWSTTVRNDFLKRSQHATIAAVQSTFPRKQWNQWEVTLKFCLEDIFHDATGCVGYTFEDKDHGLGRLVRLIMEGKEMEINTEKFSSKMSQMFLEMKTRSVPGFEASNTAHRTTLGLIRGINACEWAIYVIRKLTATL